MEMCLEFRKAVTNILNSDVQSFSLIGLLNLLLCYCDNINRTPIHIADIYRANPVKTS